MESAEPKISETLPKTKFPSWLEMELKVATCLHLPEILESGNKLNQFAENLIKNMNEMVHRTRGAWKHMDDWKQLAGDGLKGAVVHYLSEFIAGIKQSSQADLESGIAQIKQTDLTDIQISKDVVSPHSQIFWNKGGLLPFVTLEQKVLLPEHYRRYIEELLAQKHQTEK